VTDRVVQAALKLVLEPIFEADFQPCSYGFRPNRRAQDAIAELHLLATNHYEWVVEGDITACSTRSTTPRRHRRRRGLAPTAWSAMPMTGWSWATPRPARPYTIAWLAGCRRLRVRWDRDSGWFFAFVLLAGAVVCLNRL
jgi:hypothetical protein